MAHIGQYVTLNIYVNKIDVNNVIINNLHVYTTCLFVINNK